MKIVSKLLADGAHLHYSNKVSVSILAEHGTLECTSDIHGLHFHFLVNYDRSCAHNTLSLIPTICM